MHGANGNPAAEYFTLAKATEISVFLAASDQTDPLS